MGTGQSDKIDRGTFAPGDCKPCNTSGWIFPEDNMSEIQEQRLILGKKFLNELKNMTHEDTLMDKNDVRLEGNQLPNVELSKVAPKSFKSPG